MRLEPVQLVRVVRRHLGKIPENVLVRLVPCKEGKKQKNKRLGEAAGLENVTRHDSYTQLVRIVTWHDNTNRQLDGIVTWHDCTNVIGQERHTVGQQQHAIGWLPTCNMHVR